MQYDRIGVASLLIVVRVNIWKCPYGSIHTRVYTPSIYVSYPLSHKKHPPRNNADDLGATTGLVHNNSSDTKNDESSSLSACSKDLVGILEVNI